ncbi:lipopolysaccharide assembly protein LapA domain-containing protein [Blastococcus atacamensis]|uniref:lipopolysaccharide assembly protein LapA domain-containing protein n=1 Tax=Blastococcus atacamensis TaxID=2070508 RepID=UPI000CEC448A|nr:lipopolysaccharide assembly protein LapA domain-containing protein [Blastococcus atacamensis]
MSTPGPGTSGDPLSVGLNPPTTSTPAGPSGTGPVTTGQETTRPAESGPGRTPAPTRERHAGRTIGRSLALALLLFVTVVLVLFVVFNNQTVPISLVFGDVEAPLVLALLVAAALGGLLVWLAGLVRRARRRNR